MYLLRLVIGALALHLAYCSVIRNPGESAQSLYDANDKVVVLSSGDIYETTYDQSHASIIEFYNSFCGYCRSFAPIYKRFADDIHQFANIVRVAAFDCADDDNNSICRDMEIMKYPTLRYYPPFYQRSDPKNLGIEIRHSGTEVSEHQVYELMENSTSAPSEWPNLNAITATSRNELFSSLPESVDYVFIVNEPNQHSYTAQKAALDLNRIKSIQVRRINALTNAADLSLDKIPAIYVANRAQKTIDLLSFSQGEQLNRSNVRTSIEDYLQLKGVQINQTDDQIAVPDRSAPTSTQNAKSLGAHDVEKDRAIIEHVKANRATVFQSDLEKALQFSVLHELTKYNNMNAEQINALQRYVSVLKKYSPLGDSGKDFLNALNEYVSTQTTLSGKELADKIKELESKHSPIYSSSKWVGCKPSMNGKRGYSCGLWQLFHYLTIRAEVSNQSSDPLEALHAIHGFVKHFFGCTHCSEHFQSMAERNRMWDVTSKESAVIWLWKAHNEVNRRLAGDATEDAAFPKVQYPTSNTCSQCYANTAGGGGGGVVSSNSSNNINDGITNWDQNEVLHYLRHMYAHSNLNRYGVDDESILPALNSAHAAKLQISIASNSGSFSDLDIRMGVLLYAFCMLIIVVAVKMLLQRGYRKKLYAHDFSGKI